MADNISNRAYDLATNQRNSYMLKLLSEFQMDRAKGLNVKTHYNQFLLCCSVAQLFLTLCNPMDCRKPGFPVLN